MDKKYRVIPKNKGIALVAHDNRKPDLINWAKTNKHKLEGHTLYGTKTTGALITKELGLQVNSVFSGPYGGDQEIGSLIIHGKIHFLFFLWDTLFAQPHDPDVKALLRIATLWNVPMACNRSTADFIINSPLFECDYERILIPSVEEQLENI